ncbi:MAG: hypothetical protein L0Y80_12990 [Ignavibacteriae bacterium]|nr:hypothetical protein [Ignavibacteriota bacterium]
MSPFLLGEGQGEVSGNRNLFITSNTNYLLPLIFSACGFVFIGCADPLQEQPEVLRCPEFPVVYKGEATYYTFATGAGSCSFDTTLDDLMIGAMNVIDYAGSRTCGACVYVWGPRGSILIRIVDMCPECPKGNIDLSTLAFSKIADTTEGRVPILWQVVPCGMDKPITYHFMDASQESWTAVQIRNHRYPIYRLEYLDPQRGFREIRRMQYNYFVENDGLGAGPFTFRVTDVYGHVLVDSGIVHAPDSAVEGLVQFPYCVEE